MGIFGNGTSLVENLVPSGLANVATRLVEAIAINRISEKARRGRTLVVKRRNIHTQQLADLTNLSFRIADLPIHFCCKVERWQRWEGRSFEMVNGDPSYAYSCRAICAGAA